MADRVTLNERTLTRSWSKWVKVHRLPDDAADNAILIYLLILRLIFCIIWIKRFNTVYSFLSGPFGRKLYLPLNN